VLKIPSLLVFAAIMAASVGAQAQTGRTASSRDIEMKVTLESVMEKRLETVLRKILASDEVFVVANVELLADSERPEVEVLPGVVVKKTPATAAPMELPASLVKRVSLTVFLPLSMTDANIDLARTTAERMVGLKPERGDVLAVEKVKSPPEKVVPPVPFMKQFINPGTVMLLAWLLAACWALYHVSRRFLDPFLSVLREVVQTLSNAGAQRAVATREEGARETLIKTEFEAGVKTNGGGSDERKLPFAFIKERDLPALDLLLLEQSDVTAAIIIQYLPPSFAARTLSALAPSRRETILGYMSKPALINQGDVSNIENMILSKIDYIMGGEEKLVLMLDQASTTMQADILETVRRRDPELGRRLELRVVMLEDIGLLDEGGLTALSRHATVRGMAVVLKSLPHLRDKVLPKLKSGLGEWLTQETSLLGDLPDQIKEAEMRLVLQALTRLVREGKITLRKFAPTAPVVTDAESSKNGTR
jgi:flagellar motor switch protein FliG